MKADTGEVIRKNLLEGVVFDDVRNIAKSFDMKPTSLRYFTTPSQSIPIYLLIDFMRIKTPDERLALIAKILA